MSKTPMQFKGELKGKLLGGLKDSEEVVEMIDIGNAVEFFVGWLTDKSNAATIRHLLEASDGSYSDAQLVRKYISGMEAEIAELKEKIANA